MKKLKLVHQLFVGKIGDEIGMEKTANLLKESEKAFSFFDEDEPNFDLSAPNATKIKSGICRATFRGELIYFTFEEFKDFIKNKKTKTPSQ